MFYVKRFGNKFVFDFFDNGVVFFYNGCDGRLFGNMLLLVVW